jgi:hypothetical protein
MHVKVLLVWVVLYGDLGGGSVIGVGVFVGGFADIFGDQEEREIIDCELDVWSFGPCVSVACFVD